MKPFAAFLMLAAACLAADPMPSATWVKQDRFMKTFSIFAEDPAVISPGLGERYQDNKKLTLSALMVLPSKADPSRPQMGLVFTRRCFGRDWTIFSECSMLLDGVVTRIPMSVTVDGDPSQLDTPVEERALIVVNLDQIKAFLAAKECAFKIGVTEMDLSMEMKRPVVEVVKRYRAELAAGTFNEFGKTKGQ